MQSHLPPHHHDHESFSHIDQVAYYIMGAPLKHGAGLELVMLALLAVLLTDCPQAQIM
jgi:hypothetical protein